jgi:histidine ammonia-lyase
MLMVRANQLAAGGSGVDPAVLDVLADAVNRGLTVPVPTYGAVRRARPPGRASSRASAAGAGI